MYLTVLPELVSLVSWFRELYSNVSVIFEESVLLMSRQSSSYV